MQSANKLRLCCSRIRDAASTLCPGVAGEVMFPAITPGQSFSAAPDSARERERSLSKKAIAKLAEHFRLNPGYLLQAIAASAIARTATIPTTTPAAPAVFSSIANDWLASRELECGVGMTTVSRLCGPARSSAALR